jgi:hypothetical protein
LWIEHADLERVANEITACVPVVFDSTSTNFIEPIDTEQNTLFKTVMRSNCIHVLHDAIIEKAMAHANMGIFFHRIQKSRRRTMLIQEDEITIDPAMKTAMLCHTTQPFCYFGVHISICKELIQLIGRTTC